MKFLRTFILILPIILVLIPNISLSKNLFQFPGPYIYSSTGDGPTNQLAGADFDKDGYLDIVSIYPAAPEIAIFFNSGNGMLEFPAQLNLSVGTADLLQDVTTADLNDDGLIDIITSTTNGFFGVSGDENSIAINLNKGNREFGKTTLIPVSDETYWLSTADFDNDNDIDIAVTHKDSNGVSIILNNGDASFATYKYYKTGKPSRDIFSADISNDGYIDIIVVNKLEGILTFLINDRKGCFSIQDSLALQAGIEKIDGGDIDGDSDTDIVVTNQVEKNVSILENTANGYLSIRNIVPIQDFASAIQLKDMDLDNKTDFVITEYNTGNASIFKGDGNFGFSYTTSNFIGLYPHSIFAGDLNGDNYTDIGTCISGESISIMLSDGKGDFWVRNSSNSIILSALDRPYQIEIADITGDGHSDLISYTDDGSDFYRNHFNLFVNDGSNQFNSIIRIDADGENIDHGLWVSKPFGALDIDNDGDIDLILGMDSSKHGHGYWDSTYVTVLKNNGTGNFSFYGVYGNYMGDPFMDPTYLSFGDFNGDGFQDLVYTWATHSYKAKGITIQLNNGSGGFLKPTNVIVADITKPTDLAIYAIDCADMDKDNDTDIVVCDARFPWGITWMLRNNGDGTFDNPEQIYQFGYVNLRLDDLDNDEDIDAIFQGKGQGSWESNISAFFNDGTGLLGSPNTASQGVYNNIDDGDLDCDGDIDIIGVSTFRKSMGIMLNNGLGAFSHLEIPLPYVPTYPVIGDLDNDGDEDIAISFEDSSKIIIFWNRYDFVIPVELVFFKHSIFNNDIILEWSTCSESNNFGFEVQSSNHSNGFRKISFINGAGTNSNVKSYKYIDKNLESGSHYYRLKQIDLDGSFLYSEIICVNVGVPETFALSQNYPNPFNAVTTIKYQLPEDCQVKIKVYNALGQEVATLVNEHKKAGYYSVSWDAMGQASGVYFIVLKAEEYTTMRKILLIK